MTKTLRSLVAFALAFVVSACAQTPSGPTTGPTNPPVVNPTPTNPTPQPAVVHWSDLPPLTDAGKALVLKVNFGGGGFTRLPLDAKFYAPDVPTYVEGKWSAFTQASQNSGGQAKYGVSDDPAAPYRITTAWPPPDLSPADADKLCGSAKVNSVENGVITGATIYLAITVKPSCAISPGAIRDLLVHELGHPSAFVLGHDPQTGLMSMPFSSDATSTELELFVWAPRVPPGTSKPVD